MEIPDFGDISKYNAGLMDSAKNLGSQTVTKADSAVSIFTTSAKDNLTALDGFGKSTQEVLTSYKSTIKSKVNAAKDWMLNTNIADLGSLNDLLDTAAGLKRDAEALQSQITGVVSDGIGTVRGLTNDVLGPAEDALWKLQQVPFDKITDGKYWLNVATGSTMSEINDLGNLSKRFLKRTDNIIDGYKDTYADAAMAIGIGKNAGDLGHSVIYGAVLDEYGNDPMVRRTLIEAFPLAASQGNTAMLKTIIEKFGVDYLLVKYPNAIELVLSSYRMPIGATVSDFGTLGTELNSVLELISPEWFKAKSTGTGHGNLRLFSRASVSAERVLGTLPNLAYLLKVSRHYTNNSVLSTANIIYPLAVLS